MNRIGASASMPSTLLGKLGRLGRFAVFLCTAGWAFPHVCTEGMDLTRETERADRGTGEKPVL